MSKKSVKDSLSIECYLMQQSDIMLLALNSKKKMEDEDVIIKEIIVHFENKKIIKIYEKIWKYFNTSMLPFLELILEQIDSVTDIEKVSSVTSTEEISLYKTRLKDIVNAEENSYDKLSKISLLEHIEDIVDLLIEHFEKVHNQEGDIAHPDLKWFTETEMMNLLFLAITHDIGKILKLMEANGIARRDSTHEGRSVLFIEMFATEEDLTQEEEKSVDRLVKNLKKIESNSMDGTTVARFINFDSKARVIELQRLAEITNK